MQKFTDKLKSAFRIIGSCLAKPINAVSGFSGPDQRNEQPEYGVGLPDQENTPQVSFKMGPPPAELNEYKNFFDRRDGSWGAPPAFK